MSCRVCLVQTAGNLANLGIPLHRVKCACCCDWFVSRAPLSPYADSCVAETCVFNSCCRYNLCMVKQPEVFATSVCTKLVRFAVDYNHQ